MTRALNYLRGNAIGLLALFVALGGTGYAASGGFTGNGKLTACVHGNGSLTMLKAGKKCSHGATAVAWNQAGPPGAKGATGPSGATGASGASGAKGEAGPAGPSATIEWARVGFEGDIIAGEGVVEVRGTTSPYIVVFDRNVEECAVTATSNEFVADDKVTSTASNMSNSIRVHVRNSAEAEQAAEFSITATCS